MIEKLLTRRWDINAIEDLPDYMKICFLGFYNTINEITYDTLTSRGFHILPYLKKVVINPSTLTVIIFIL